MAVFYTLRSMGITRKKAITYMEQEPVKVENHLQQLRRLGDYQTVYVDETSCSAYLYREYGRAKKEKS